MFNLLGFLDSLSCLNEHFLCPSDICTHPHTPAGGSWLSLSCPPLRGLWYALTQPCAAAGACTLFTLMSRGRSPGQILVGYEQ